MGGFLFWLAVVFCVIALVLLFFPIRFKIEFEAGESGGRALFFFWGKRLWTGEKKWGKKDSEVVAKDEGAEPEFVATAPVRPAEKKSAPAEKPAAEEHSHAEENVAPKEGNVAEEKKRAEEKPAAVAAVPVAEMPEQKSVAEEKPADAVAKPLPVPAAPVEQNSAQPKEKTDDASEDSEEPGKKKKRKLTDEEFWTIILTPELDGRAFRYLKSFLGMSIRLFKIKFVNCFVEGIRSDYESMGYGAALNGMLKGFPYLRAWDFRMDWCHNRELHAQGEIHARTNLCRVFSLALAMFVYAGILFLLFWRRRSHVLKTGELPELGFIRKKIVGWMVEE